MKIQNSQFAFIFIMGMFFFSCNSISKKEENSDNLGETTPVAKEELSELPPDATFNDTQSLLEVLTGDTEFDTFVKSIKSANMLKLLDSIDEATVFAPTNGAFNRITASKLAYLKTEAGRDEMENIIRYHIVSEEYDYETLKSTIRLNDNILRLKTLDGGFVALSIENDEVYLTDEAGFQSKIIAYDLEAENGVVHKIDPLLLVQQNH